MGTRPPYCAHKLHILAVLEGRDPEKAVALIPRHAGTSNRTVAIARYLEALNPLSQSQHV